MDTLLEKGRYFLHAEEASQKKEKDFDAKKKLVDFSAYLRGFKPGSHGRGAEREVTWGLARCSGCLRLGRLRRSE